MPNFEELSGAPAQDSSLTTSQLLLEATRQQSSSWLGDLGRSAVHSFAQAPLEGVAQLIDGQANGKARQAVHFIDAPEHAEFGSARWLAQQAGSAIGAIPWVLAVHKGVSGTLNRSFTAKATLTMAEHTTALTGRQALAAGSLKAFESGMTGMIYSGLLTPVSSDEKDFWTARARNGAVGMLAFSTLSASGTGLKHLGESTRLTAPALSRLAGSEVAAGVISGVPAGLMAANADSLLQGKGFAGLRQNFESAAGFSIMGGGFAFGKQKLADLGGAESSRVNQVAPETFRNAGVDVDGRPLAQSNRAAVAQNLPDYARGDMGRARTQTLRDMSEIKASSPGQSVLDQFRNSNLSIEQKFRVLSSMAEVREHFVKQRVNGQLDPDQAGNWIHTQGEFGRVVDATRAARLSAPATEDALLGSMFADAVKTKASFHVHHMDGALAADHVLGKYMGGNFTRNRLDGIVHSIREHQIGPPEFMANVMYGGKIKFAVEAAQKAPMTTEQLATWNSLKAKIADPLNAERVRLADGGTALKLTPQERAMLELTGAKEWYVPDAGNRWNAQSRAVINGDTLDNYFTPGGIGKIASLGGPETDVFFKTLRIDGPTPGTERTTNIGSARNSGADAASLLTPEVRSLAGNATAATEAAIAQAKAKTAQWLQRTHGIDPNKTEVPFFNADLKYPNFNGNAALENQWWSIHKTAADKRPAADQALYDQHRYIGLSEPEVAAFQRAQDIRNQVVNDLRASQRVNGDAPPNYQPATRN